jgi:hypothetical protein
MRTTHTLTHTLTHTHTQHTHTDPSLESASKAAMSRGTPQHCTDLHVFAWERRESSHIQDPAICDSERAKTFFFFESGLAEGMTKPHHRRSEKFRISESYICNTHTLDRHQWQQDGKDLDQLAPALLLAVVNPDRRTRGRLFRRRVFLASSKRRK